MQFELIDVLLTIKNDDFKSCAIWTGCCIWTSEWPHLNYLIVQIIPSTDTEWFIYKPSFLLCWIHLFILTKIFFLVTSCSFMGLTGDQTRAPKPYVLIFIGSVLPLSLSLPLSILDTPHLNTAPGPHVECCIVRGLWRKGIPGHDSSASKHTHTHHTHTHTHTNTAVESHHNPLADFQVKDEWFWKVSFSRERAKEKEKNPYFFHVCTVCIKHPR